MVLLQLFKEHCYLSVKPPAWAEKSRDELVKDTEAEWERWRVGGEEGQMQ